MRQALGKGIGALIPSAAGRVRTQMTETRGEAAVPDRAVVREIPIAAVGANPRQPRQAFSPEALSELARSIAEHGVLQPILVRAVDSARYELIAGERRLRAARLAGRETVPAVIKQTTDDQSLILAIVENIQRADLSPLEEARGYQELVQAFSLTQEEVAARVGKSRPAVANTLRLLHLPKEVQAELAAGRITAGHARALLALDGDRARIALTREVVQRRLSVRDTELAVTRAKEPPLSRRDPDVRRMEAELARALGTKVSIHLSRSAGSPGRVEIAFFSDDDLGRLVDLLLAAPTRLPSATTARP